MIHVSQALHEAIDHMKTLEGNKMNRSIEINVWPDSNTCLEFRRNFKGPDSETEVKFGDGQVLGTFTTGGDDLVTELRRCADAIAKAVEAL